MDEHTIEAIIDKLLTLGSSLYIYLHPQSAKVMKVSKQYIKDDLIYRKIKIFYEVCGNTKLIKLPRPIEKEIMSDEKTLELIMDMYIDLLDWNTSEYDLSIIPSNVIDVLLYGSNTSELLHIDSDCCGRKDHHIIDYPTLCKYMYKEQLCTTCISQSYMIQLLRVMYLNSKLHSACIEIIIQTLKEELEKCYTDDDTLTDKRD